MEEVASWSSYPFFLYTSFLIFLLLIIPKLKLMIFSKQTLIREKLPPSPPSLPIIGHLHLLKQPIHQTLEHLSQKYGPIFSLSFGSRTVLIISSLSSVKESFTKNDIILANRPRLLSGKHLNYDYTTLGAVSYGPLWRNLRRISTLEIFSTTRLNMFSSIREEEVKFLLKNLFENVSSQKGLFVKVEMRSRLSELSFNIIMRMLSGKRYFGNEIEGDCNNIEEAKEFRDIIRETLELSGASSVGDYIGFLRWIDFDGLEKRMKRLGRRADGFLQGLIDEHRVNKLQGGEAKKTMIDNMLSLQESEPDIYSDQVIKALILNLLTAGTDTSAVTLEWAMSLLLNNPTVIKKAITEIKNQVGSNHLVNESDLPKLKYIQNIVKETLRLYPAAPLLVPHLSSEDCTIEGFDVEKDTIVMVNAWAIHRDPLIWVEPTSFKPERYVDGHDEGYRFIPFGVGRRSCPGAGLANRVVGLALAVLIQCFEWERVGVENVDMGEGLGLTMPKAVPLEAICKARSSMISVLSEL